MTDRQPPALLIAATTQELRRHAPFDAMAPAELDLLASRLRVRYFARGEVLLAPARGPVTELFIVQRGEVRGRSTDPSQVEAATLLEGELFPVGALIARRATTLEYTAATDTFVYVLGEARFLEVMAASREFHAFCTRRLAHLLERSASAVRESFAGRASAELGMETTLAQVVRHAPVTLPSTASVRAVLECLRDRRVGSVVLTGEAGQPEGIFTRTDVLDRVALGGGDLGAPVSGVMTRAPVSLPASSTVAHAAETMARLGIRHLLVDDEGRLAGVISERDLFALQRRSVQGLRKEIARADSPHWLAHAAREARGIAGSLLAQGIAAEALMQLVTALNDAIVERAVALAAPGHGVSAGEFCWLGLGSEGRREQTLATDQDNAIVFADTAPAGSRERLLAFATEVNDTLAACGFPLCKGNIMARNPQWCLPLAEWTRLFDSWMRNTQPEALLNAAIFFDLRPLAGHAPLGEALRAFVREHGGSRPAFLRQMAVNALQVRPPVGLLEEVLAGGEPLDLKMHATRPFVDCARILALAAGTEATATAARLREAGPVVRMDPGEVEACVQAFHFVQMLRLRRQEEGGIALEHPNRIDLAALNPLDRRILREALRQARKLQNRVALDYKL